MSQSLCVLAPSGSYCGEMYNCCSCGGPDEHGSCGCDYCFDCHACDACRGDYCEESK